MPTSTTTSDADEWTVVNHATHKRKKFSKRSGNPTTTRHDGKKDDDDEASVAQVQARLKECRRHLQSSHFWRRAQQICKQQGNSTHVQEMVCYGIGNFAQSSSQYSGPLWQLALALELRQLIQQQQQQSLATIKMVYYDPLVTDRERQILQHYEIQVLARNERGQRTCCKGATTLFYMPHCPKGLYENLLWANWDCLSRNPQALQMVGNSLVTYVERSSHNRNGETSCLQLVQPHVKEYAINYDKADRQQLPGQFEAAFNDAYWTLFDHCKKEDDDDNHDKDWPSRPEQPSEDGQNEVL